MNVETFLKWKILPRLMMLVSTIMSWRCAEWFMALDEPTASQSAFVSVVMGVMTGVFGIWMGHEHKGDNNVTSTDRSAQIDVLKEDARGNWFQSSWRPLIGWISGLSLGINYMVAPICAGFGITIPQADMSVMMPLMFGMLGIGGMRSYDKMKKTDTKK